VTSVDRAVCVDAENDMTIGWNSELSWRSGAALSAFLVVLLIGALSLHLVGLAVTLGICLVMLIPATIVGRTRERRSGTAVDETESPLAGHLGPPRHLTRARSGFAAASRSASWT
jgi:hypothetical protein